MTDLSNEGADALDLSNAPTHDDPAASGKAGKPAPETEANEPEDEAEYEAEGDNEGDDPETAETEEGEDEGDDPAAEEHEEFEHEGKKYRVPKAVKPLLMMQQDYTRKTQALSEEKKAFESAAQQRAKSIEEAERSAREYVQEFSQLHTIDQQIAQAEKIDWDAWDQQSPFEAQSAWRKVQMLKDQREKIVSSVHEKEQQRTLHSQRELAKRVEEVRSFAQSLPGYDAEMDQQAREIVESFGWDDAQIRQNLTPKLVAVLHEALTARRNAARAKAAVKPPPKQEAKPLKPTVKGRSGPIKGLDDRLSADEWIKRRNEQTARRRP